MLCSDLASVSHYTLFGRVVQDREVGKPVPFHGEQPIVLLLKPSLPASSVET